MSSPSPGKRRMDTDVVKLYLFYIWYDKLQYSIPVFFGVLKGTNIWGSARFVRLVSACFGVSGLCLQTSLAIWNMRFFEEGCIFIFVLNYFTSRSLYRLVWNNDRRYKSSVLYFLLLTVVTPILSGNVCCAV